MKKISYIIIGVSIIAALLYGLAHMATSHAAGPSFVDDSAPKPPADYPTDYALQLEQMPHITVRLHDEAETPMMM